MNIKADVLSDSKLTDINTELVVCPNCAQQLQPNDVAQHCEQEMEQLQRLPVWTSNGDEITAETSTITTTKTITENNTTEERRKPWTVFQKVQRNRHSRLKQRSRKRAATSTPQERACPVCNNNFPQDDIERHVEACLRRSKVVNGQQNDAGQSSSEEEDGSEEYEEYEWAGQKRIRVSSLLQGGYAAHGIGQIINSSNGNGRQETDEEEDLNVDEDDTHIYGPPQYEESDIISPDAGSRDRGDNEEEDVTSYMRKLITAGRSISSNCLNGEREKERTDRSNNEETRLASEEATTSTNGVVIATDSIIRKTNAIAYEQIIESLKLKLRLYEQQQQNKFKCLICLDEYRKPTISVSCWHVHCEDCWLRSLGTRKLCPQCNVITTPKDLRRIYM